MENILYIFIVMFSIIGWYILIKEIIYQLLYKNINLTENIKCQITVKNEQEDIEVILRKLIYIQNKTGIFKTIEIIDNNSSDETHEIIKKMQKEYPTIKLIKIL